MPRMKRACSGIASKASSARRLISRKSPASSGISTSVSAGQHAVEGMAVARLNVVSPGARGCGRHRRRRPARAHLCIMSDSSSGGSWRSASMTRMLLAPAQIEARGQRELVTVVTRQIDGDQARVLRRQLAHHLPAAIPRAVVDQHDLIILADRRPGGRGQALVQGGQALLLVEAGYDDRQRGHGCGGPRVCRCIEHAARSLPDHMQAAKRIRLRRRQIDRPDIVEGVARDRHQRAGRRTTGPRPNRWMAARSVTGQP